MKNIETPHFKVWLGEDGIIRFRWTPGMHVTLDLAKQTEKPVARFNTKKTHPLLVFLDGTKSIDRDARICLSNMAGPSAVALVGVSPIARIIGNMFIGLNRQVTLPLRMFTTEDKAVQWLKGFNG